jgi:hypothetical protein
LKTTLSIISGIIFLAAFIPYIRAILFQGAKPSKVSWLVWALNDMIALGAMYAASALNFTIVGAVCGAWIVTGLAFRFGETNWRKIDLYCLGGSLAGLAVALVFQVLGISFEIHVLEQTIVVKAAKIVLASSMIALLVGSITTFDNAWHEPHEENFTAWAMYLTSCIVSLFAVPMWDFENAAQPITFTVIEAIVVGILLYRRFVPAPTTAKAAI